MTQNPTEYAPPQDAGLFGCTPQSDTQRVTIIGVPWEPTASYGRGCSKTPHAIIPVSHQLDLYDPFLQRDFGQEVALTPLRGNWEETNRQCIALATPIIAEGGRLDQALSLQLHTINQACSQLNEILEDQANEAMAQGQIVGVLGGDHAAPLGAIRAHAKCFPKMGLLHIDAHHDLRDAYEGFQYSHASIMFNVLKEAPFQGPLVSVGIRDYSSEERQFALNHPQIITHYDRDIFRNLSEGFSWSKRVDQILEPLPRQVYVSFDIDGLDPKLCPNTGTPVPGGLSYQQVIFLLEQMVRSGRQIIGFDLCEVTPGDGDWDLNVGARVLHKLAALACAPTERS